MSAPSVGSIAQAVYADIAPLAWDDANRGYPLLVFVGALAGMFQQVNDLASDTADGPGYSQILDVMRCPTAFLPWLGQFVGVVVDQSADDATQRAQIHAEPGFARGTPAAIIAAAQRYLTGTKSVRLIERAGDAYALTVITHTAETPDSDIVQAALDAAKPAGILLTYLVRDGQTWSELIADNATWADVKSAYATWGDVIDNTP